MPAAITTAAAIGAWRHMVLTRTRYEEMSTVTASATGTIRYCPLREGTSAEIGPNIDFYFKLLVKLKRITVFELDPSKSRLLALRLRYRYMPETNGAAEHRGLMICSTVAAGAFGGRSHKQNYATVTQPGASAELERHTGDLDAMVKVKVFERLFCVAIPAFST